MSNGAKEAACFYRWVQTSSNEEAKQDREGQMKKHGEALKWFKVAQSHGRWRGVPGVRL